MNPEHVQVRLAAKRSVATNVVEFRFETLDGAALPAFLPGDHVEILTPSGLARCYSATEGPHGADGGWSVAIAHDPAGSGGSASMHRQTAVGDIMRVRPPANSFAFSTSRDVLLIAGGIGITPIRSMYHAARRRGTRCEMLYLGASRSEAAYSAEFTGDPDVIFHMRDEHADRFDLWNVLRDPGEREVYCCGSPALMEQVRALTMHWRPSRVHFEDFSGVSPLDEFSSPFSASWEPTGTCFPCRLV